MHETTPSADELPETVIESEAGWKALNLRELWQRRELIFFLAWRDVKVRYRQTWVGAGWALLQPAMMTVVLTIFLGGFSGRPENRIPYPLYIYSGFLAWTFFANALVGGGMSVVGAEGMITKIYFPRLVIPIASVASSLVDFLIASIGLGLLMIRYRVAPGWGLLAVPLWLVLVAFAGFGVGTLLAALNVRYRDFRYLMPFIIQVWFFSTPAIFLPSDEVPMATIFGSQELLAKVRLLLQRLNPVNSLIVSFRKLALGEEVPWESLGVSAAIIGVFVAVGVYYFRRVEDSFADVI